ncbi:MAG: DUF3800 domain-containing protein [Anaerolineae bacterium]
MRRYRLYIDESGDHTYHALDNPAKRYLGLLGLFVDTESYRAQFQPALEYLKQTHFPHNPDEPVILHRKDVINRRGPFWRLRDRECERRFNEDLLQFLTTQDYTLILVVIDKKSHIERYGTAAFHPYHYCLIALLERYCGFLNHFNAQGDVMAESRGGTEDRQLQQAYWNVYNSGTLFRDATFFQRVLTSKEIKLKRKEANIAGLQIADLLAHPAKQNLLVREGRISEHDDVFGEEICKRIECKYNRHFSDGRIRGYGKVFLK